MTSVVSAGAVVVVKVEEVEIEAADEKEYSVCLVACTCRDGRDNNAFTASWLMFMIVSVTMMIVAVSGVSDVALKIL